MTYLIGCSGYYYPARIGKFYPSHLPKSEWLRLYASHFNAIEINNTFYRTPTLKTLQKRYNDTPEEFSFVLKIPQSITHEKKMQGVEEELVKFMEVAKQGLNHKLKAFLFQLPPSLHYSEEVLESIMTLPHETGIDYVFEFRHKSRRREDVMVALENNGDIFCSVSHPTLPDTLVSGKTQYIRLHGVPVLYKSGYGEQGLEKVIQHLQHSKPEVGYILFNNTRFGEALNDIITLKSLIS